jgi:superfamily II DNA helicase RecQ
MWFIFKVEAGIRHIALVISPLLSLIEDQRRELENHNISSLGVTHETFTDLDGI